ncbi:MAG: alpha-ketoglutarate-dependent taurine dioxygenase [Acidimicrobiales bacterium]|jgi:alpha-ketoglutarate-dependent taurine dioxygenase
MSGMQITPIDRKVFGATVTGVALRDLTDDQFSQIKTAFLDRGFLVFPGQFLTSEENIAFGERFGPLEFGALPLANKKRHKDGTFSADVLDINSQTMRSNVGNETWHTDSTYKPLSSKCAMLSAVVVPDEEGETELADMRAGYAALDEETKDRIDGFSAYHSNQFSQANDLGDFPRADSDGFFKDVYHLEAYLRPVVKVHPETGVKNLFLGRHAFGIPGLERDESRELLRSLLEFVVSDETRVYQHRWQAGDTMIWDNRALLHRARPYDYSKPRVLIGTRVAGDDTELSYYPDDPAAQAGRDALAAELEILRGETKHLMYGATTAGR